MFEPSVDIELTDMASGMGVSLRDLMAGVMTGRYDRVMETDLVRNENGEPIFFRLPQSRAYTIFGEDLDRVRKDLSTIEQMGSSDDRENTPDVGGPLSVPSSREVATGPEPETGGGVATSTESGASVPDVGTSVPSTGGSTATATEVDPSREEASRENTPPARTDRDPQGGAVQPTTEQGQGQETAAQTRENGGVPAKTGQGTSFSEVVGTMALTGAATFAGVGLVSWLFSGGQGQQKQTRGLSGRQEQDLLDQGYYGYYQGVKYNPYDPATEAGRLYEQGWREAQREVIRNPMLDTRLA